MKQNGTHKMNSRRIVAIIGLALLLLLYLATLITAFLDHSASATWFRLCLGGTVAVPLVIWIYSWMYSRLTGKPALGDPAASDGEEVMSESSEDPS